MRHTISMKLVFLLASTFLFEGCQKAESAAISKRIRPAKVHVVGSTTLSRERIFPGTVQASNTVNLAFRVGGPLVALPAIEGKEVEVGTVLARIDPRDFEVRVRSAEAQLSAAKAQLRHARVNHARIQKLAAQNVVPEAQVDDVSAQLDIAKAQVHTTERALEAARLALRDTVLRAPFAGRIAAVHVNNHQSVNARQPAIQLQGSGGLEVEIDVPETTLAALTKASENDLKVGFESLALAPKPAKIVEYATEIDAETKTYTVTLAVEMQHSSMILPGMTASVYWQPHLHGDRFMIPVASVGTHSNGDPIVYRLDADDRLEPVSVKVGQLTKTGIELREGLSKGDRILAAGVRAARAGLKVRPLTDARHGG